MIILGTNSIKDTGFDVANSCRFNIGSSDHLTRSLGGSPTSTRKATWSYWVKRSTLTSSASEIIYSNEVADDNNRGYIQFEDNDSFRMVDSVSSTQLKTNRLFRDVGAFYHICFAIDTTQGTAANRIKLYVNGVQETSFATASYPSQNDDLKILTGGQTNKQHISKIHGGAGYFGGYLSEFVFIDGLQLAPDQFGEFDEDSGIWKPINVSGLTFGNNGFYLDFEDSSALGNDKAGSNNFTVNNLTAIDQSTDTCTNNFATFNPLDNYYPASTFSEGNLKIVTSSNETYNTSTIGVSSGKWYFEVEWDATSSGTSVVGIVDSPSSATSASLHKQSKGWGYRDGGDVKNNDSAVSGSWSSYTTGDIIGIALDLDNNRLFFSKNGSFQNSGDPTSSTGAITITAPSSLTTGNYFFAIGDYNSGTTTLLANFGGTQSFTVSSGNADGNGYGNFEYAVPSGYYSLNTKNLGEFG